MAGVSLGFLRGALFVAALQGNQTRQGGSAPLRHFGGGVAHKILGLDSFSILFSHRSFQKPAVFAGFLVVF